MKAEFPTAKPRAYADDWAVSVESSRKLILALRRTAEMADDMGMQISPGKSLVWATCQNLRVELSNIELQGERIPLVHEARYLGAFLGFDKRRHRTRVARHLPLPQDLPQNPNDKTANGSQSNLGGSAGHPQGYVCLQLHTLQCSGLEKTQGRRGAHDMGSSQ